MFPSSPKLYPLFLCSLKIFPCVPLFPRNKLPCSPVPLFPKTPGRASKLSLEDPKPS